MKVYTIIVTYNPLKWIDRCLTCLKSSSIETQIIIVDNMSTDGARDYIPTKYPETIWLPQDRNLGFGQANNIGISYAMGEGADYVLLLNQDAYVERDMIEKIIQCSDGKSVLTPIQMNSQCTNLDTMFKIGLQISDLWMLDDMLIKGCLAPTYKADVINAACWMLPRSVIETIGGFNPIFFHYGEDDNYCQRLKYHGMDLLVVTKARMIHDREVHGNIKMFNRKKIWRDILLIECDINKNWKQRSKDYLKLLKKLYVKDLRIRQYIPFALTVNMLRMWLDYGKIKESRRVDKGVGQNWL